MKISTNWRWLLLCAVVLGLAAPAQAQRNVTLRLNTATLPDTTTATVPIEVRGCLAGCEGDQSELPDSDVIAWNSNTTLRPANTGGDYWEIDFQIPENEELNFKFFSPQAEDPNADGNSADGIGGWEDGDNHVIAAGTGDVDTTLHYFEKGEDKPYDWVPWEVKEDSIAVYFRVWMNTEEALGEGIGYDPEDENQIIGIRGGPPAGNDAWDITLAELTRESDDNSKAGYHMYSGVVYYAASAADSTQMYKFIVEPAGWETSPDRSFTIPDQDTTLQWVYFSNSRPASQPPVESLVIFSVDLSPLEEIGLFDQARGDTLWVLGGFNGWGDCIPNTPDQCLLQKVPGENQFETALPMSLIPGQNLLYKYFLDFNDQTFMQEFGVEPPSGWEEGHNTGINRVTPFVGSETQDVGIAYFNDVHPLNVIPEGTSIDVHFSVDMTPALSAPEPFDPAGGDSVTVRFGDPIWAFTQGIVVDDRDGGDFPLAIDEFVLEDPDSDNVYEGTFTVEGPTYSIVTFRFAYGQGNAFSEDNGLAPGAEPGRNRTYFIDPNQDGSWPAEYTIDHGTFQVETAALPFETNPAFAVGIEEVDGELPSRITLEQNYPNPFNPATTFEYAIDQAQHVRVRVYDLMGRNVATLVDGVQQAATYRVSFDAGELASGMYVYQLETPTRTISKKMVLIK